MIWNTEETTYNNAGIWSGLLFRELIMTDAKSLVTSSQNDQDYWSDFTLATDLWENFTTQTWEGTVFTEVE